MTRQLEATILNYEQETLLNILYELTNKRNWLDVLGQDHIEVDGQLEKVKCKLERVQADVELFNKTPNFQPCSKTIYD